MLYNINYLNITSLPEDVNNFYLNFIESSMCIVYVLGILLGIVSIGKFVLLILVITDNWQNHLIK